MERYRNSPVMHRTVPDPYKPVIFKDLSVESPEVIEPPPVDSGLVGV